LTALDQNLFFCVLVPMFCANMGQITIQKTPQASVLPFVIILINPGNGVSSLLHKEFLK